MRVGEPIQDGVLPFYAGKIRIAVSSAADHLAAEMDPEDVSQSEILPSLVRIRIHAGFERSQQGSALIDILAQLSTLLIAQERNVRQDKC